MLTGDQRNLTTANYEVALQKQGLLVEETRKQGLENDWAESTMQPRIEKTFQDIIAGNAEIIETYRDWETDRKSTRLNSSHITRSRMPSSA